jgi:hypothetical protein
MLEIELLDILAEKVEELEVLINFITELELAITLSGI